MGTEYRLFCKDCDVLSLDSIGSVYVLYTDNMVIEILKKHWSCKEGVRIVNCDTYGILDYKLDDGKPESLPFWCSILTIKKPTD